MMSCWALLFRFRPRQGVCDTPLHLFVYCRGQIQLIIIPVRLFFWWLLVCVLVSFSPTSGRMRYAPTPVCLLSWPNTINHYPRSIVFWWLLVCVLVSFSPTSGRMRYAPTHVRLKTIQTTSWQNRQINRDDTDSGHTKPSKRLRRCWLGSHKTLETVATTLIRVTQNRRNDRYDANLGHTKPPKRLRRRWLGSHKTIETVVTTKLCSHSLINAVVTVKMSHRSLHRC